MGSLYIYITCFPEDVPFNQSLETGPAFEDLHHAGELSKARRPGRTVRCETVMAQRTDPTFGSFGWRKNGDFVAFKWVYPLVNITKTMEHPNV